jgi:small subunit ribosomal protein S14
MKYLINKDTIKRNTFKKYELKRLYLKYIIYNNNIKKKIRINAMLLLNKFPKNSSYIRIKNRCIITGRSKSVYRDFKVSRMILRNLAHNGLLSGVIKSSW